MIRILTMMMIGMILRLEAEDLLAPADQPPPAVVPAQSRIAPADAAAVKSAHAQVREVYAGRYAAKSERGKRTLGRMMLRHVTWHRSNAAIAEVLLRESLRLACEVDDFETVLSAIDTMEKTFTGISIADERRKAFQEVARRPFIVALQKLLDTPDDARACGIAGRWLGLSAGRWDEALPLLCQATSDADLQKLATAEVAADDPGKLFKSAEGWLEGTKRFKGDERIGALKHVLDLAQRALPGLTGITKTQADQLIAKVAPQIPLDLDLVDWSTLTGEQWERIPYPAIPVIAKLDRIDPKISLAEGEVVRVVANPDDRWTFELADNTGPFTTDWKGVYRLYTYIANDDNGPRSVTVSLGVQRIRYGAVLAFTDINKRMRAGLVRGPGKLWLGPSSDHRGEKTTSGSIRVKIVPVYE